MRGMPYLVSSGVAVLLAYAAVDLMGFHNAFEAAEMPGLTVPSRCFTGGGGGGARAACCSGSCSGRCSPGRRCCWKGHAGGGSRWVGMAIVVMTAAPPRTDMVHTCVVVAIVGC